ncbi:microprocessor complex subunit DGCR8 [Tetranychus urticae]|uniref:DRBM domain-containing protein n=1 Tax=Tetranychus urticae TaxID=32264 RepID=T1L3L1_TETUR|nr:microprocessor complex subunit DGCR8 [Tetranychus urticae]
MSLSVVRKVEDSKESVPKKQKISDETLEQNNGYSSEEAISNDENWEQYHDSDSDIPLDTIDDMLEESLKKVSADSRHLHSGPGHEERKKIVLKKRDKDYFEMLPEGWIEVTHFSGMPIYLHKQSRVCTLAKPYYLGPGSARKHEVPISAIPCLAYKREVEKEKSNEVEETHNESNSQLPILGKVESVAEAKKEKSLDFLAIRDYCSNVFEFEEITVRKFKTWADRRKHIQMKKMEQRPSLPEGTKLIKFPLPKHTESSDPARKNCKEFLMNPAGKSAVCILHEFVQHAERVQPKYVFKELENASMPYSATVLINDMEYGVGYGSSKKQAKAEAARATLEILIPDIRDMTQDGNSKVDTSMQDLTFFDDIKVEDQRVSELCSKAGQHSPYQILVECLKRNYGMGDTEIKTDVRLIKHQRNEFTMNVGKHSATVICRNKREGKQRAAQAILQLLHPQITSWGSLLRLYGRGSCKTPKEKKEEEQKITELQNTACANRPNYAILNKLREEMLKLRASDENRNHTKEPLRLILCSEDKSDAQSTQLVDCH